MTLGWIREDAVERFFDATEPRYVVAGVARHICPHCGTIRSSHRALLDHLHAEHSSRRPALLISGREPGQMDTIRCAPAKDQIHLIDCEKIWASVNGGEPVNITHGNLLNLLSDCGLRHLNLRAENSSSGTGRPTRKEYSFRVMLPSPEHLSEADREFVSIFAVKAPHISHLGKFGQHLRDGPAADYVEGLVEYVRGMLIKDSDRQAGIVGMSAEWSEAYKRSLQILDDYERPLSRLLCSLMRFALNDFTSARAATDFEDLDVSQSIFCDLAASRAPSVPPIASSGLNQRNVCPLDAGVSRIIELTQRCIGLQRWSGQDQSELEALTGSDVLNGFDRAKALALWAWTAERLGSKDFAVDALGRLRGTTCSVNGLS